MNNSDNEDKKIPNKTTNLSVSQRDIFKDTNKMMESLNTKNLWPDLAGSNTLLTAINKMMEGLNTKNLWPGLADSNTLSSATNKMMEGLNTKNLWPGLADSNTLLAATNKMIEGLNTKNLWPGLAGSNNFSSATNKMMEGLNTKNLWPGLAGSNNFSSAINKIMESLDLSDMSSLSAALESLTNNSVTNFSKDEIVNSVVEDVEPVFTKEKLTDEIAIGTDSIIRNNLLYFIFILALIMSLSSSIYRAPSQDNKLSLKGISNSIIQEIDQLLQLVDMLKNTLGIIYVNANSLIVENPLAILFLNPILTTLFNIVKKNFIGVSLTINTADEAINLIEKIACNSSGNEKDKQALRELLFRNLALISKSKTYVRCSPSKKSKSKVFLNKNQLIIIANKQKRWIYVMFDNEDEIAYGWVPSKYLKYFKS